jgi:amino acid transporter, AAT family
VLSVAAPKSAYILMVSISAFGPLFAWMMIFVTHYYFRRARARAQAEPLRFGAFGYPATTLPGAALMFAVLLTRAFTEEFRMTLAFGLSFVGVLSAVYWIWYRPGARRMTSSAQVT